jgi:3',5'-cyclic AMP phosphodiesterase CpdA
MEDVITWLHVSDWHQGNKGKLDRRVVRDALMADIRQQMANRFDNHIDFLVFSGDLAFRGTADEYALAEIEFLEPLREAARVDKSRMILTPGNHDLDRSRLQWGPTFPTIFKEPRPVAEAFEDPEVRTHLLFGIAQSRAPCFGGVM